MSRKLHPFATLCNRSLVGLPAKYDGKVGDIVGQKVVVRNCSITSLLPALKVVQRPFEGRLACTVDRDGHLAIATADVMPDWPCSFGWETLVRKPDFYLTDVTVEALNTTSTKGSVRMPLAASDVDTSLYLYDGDVYVDPALVKALVKPRLSFPFSVGIVTRIVRSHGEAVMFEVTTVMIDHTGKMTGRVRDFFTSEHPMRRTIVWYANSSRHEASLLYPSDDDDDM
jgi:hypothetical protein